MEEKGKKKLQLDYYQTSQTNSRKQTEHQDGANQRPNSRNRAENTRTERTAGKQPKARQSKG